MENPISIISSPHKCELSSETKPIVKKQLLPVCMLSLKVAQEKQFCFIPMVFLECRIASDQCKFHI